MSLRHFLSPPPPLHPKPSLPILPLKPHRTSHSTLTVTCTNPSSSEPVPSVRTYNSRYARLSLVGPVDLNQALTAAAADGGDSAAQHLRDGIETMVLETVIPEDADEANSVSTKLFLPSREVEEKARKLKQSLGESVLSGNSPNILATTFRQVVLQRLQNFEMVLFEPGTEQNIEDLESDKEASAYFTLSSSDERIISVLAEAVCISSLHSTERHFLNSLMGESSNSPFSWFRKPRKFASKDTSVVIYKLFEDEMIENAESLLKSFKSATERGTAMKPSPRQHWWTLSVQSKLEKIGGPEFSSWASECIPAYKLQINAAKFNDVKFQGWEKYGENKWEILLTHSQMVGLANVLDMYYEDIYSIPSKQLPSNEVANYTKLLSKKRNSSLVKMLSFSFASGIFVVAVGALGQLYLPYLGKGAKYTGDPMTVTSSEIDFVPHQSEDPTKSEIFCNSVIQKIKDGFGWSGDIRREARIGTWTGELPSFLREVADADFNAGTSSSSSSEVIEKDAEMSVQEIASYQVVLSADGKVVGFQPTSQIAVNHWASNPLAKELYGGRKLSPGVIEPSLKIQNPGEVFVVELLVSTSPDVPFALARTSEM